MAANDPYTRDFVTIKRGDRTAEVSPKAVEAYRQRGWEPLTETTPTSKATVGELRAWATEKDPDNAEAIAAMTKAELREQYGL